MHSTLHNTKGKLQTESGVNLLIAGVGNVLMGDDGAGIEVIRRLRQRKLPAWVELFEAGVQSFRLLAKLRGYNRAIIVDAMRGGEPGRVYVLTPQELGKPGMIFSLHDFSLEHLISTARELYGEEFPEQIEIVGIGIKAVEHRLGLSQEVERGVERAVEFLLEEIGCV